MSVIRWLGLFLLNIVVFALTWLVVLLVLPLAKRDKDNVLPTWLWWLNTQDDPGCDQGMHVDANGKPVPGKYEQQVKDKFDKYGWRFKTWYWLGWRNMCYGLFDRLAPTVTGKATKTVGKYWRVLRLTQADGKKYWCFLNNAVDVGWGWKLFNDDKPGFYFRPRFWKKPSN